MSVARLLVVEDDPSIRRFVAMAIEPLPVEVVEAASIVAARRALRDERFDVLLTDLRLPDGSGLELATEPGRDGRGAGRVIVFSASVPARIRSHPAEFGIWRILDKPAPLPQLLQVLCQALDIAAPLAAVRAPGAGAHPPAAQPTLRHDERARAIATHFAGNAKLFDEFRASCLRQFHADLEAGDAAASRGDAAALRREAHNLKTVLQLLGAQQGSDCADALERAAARNDDWHVLGPRWSELRTIVLGLL